MYIMYIYLNLHRFFYIANKIILFTCDKGKDYSKPRL